MLQSETGRTVQLAASNTFWAKEISAPIMWGREALLNVRLEGHFSKSLKETLAKQGLKKFI